MNPSQSELLTAQFYDWERRGRGWLSNELPIELEPPFYPFINHSLPPSQYRDEGHRPTFFSQLGDFFRGTGKPQHAVAEEEPFTFPLEVFPFENNEPLRFHSLVLPKSFKVGIDETEHLLLMLSYCKAPVSFEVIANSSVISIQFATRESDSIYLQSQLKAYFPESMIMRRNDPLEEIVAGGTKACINEFALRDEFMRPMNMTRSLSLDPFTGLFGVLENLGEGEAVFLQVLFQGTGNRWAESILRSVMDNQGGPFFTDAPEMVPLTKEKISSPLFAVTIKLLTTALNGEEAMQLGNTVGNALVRISSSDSNRLIPLNGENDFNVNLDDIVNRQSHRIGMLLNSHELTTIVHYPSTSISSTKLERDRRKTKVAPAFTDNQEFVIGINSHQGQVREVSLNNEQRLKHTHIIGATGTGKSTFLLNLIKEDMELGNGFAVLDPHGDLIESILFYVPDYRRKDILLIDPADSDYPIGFNILQAHSDIEKEILSSDLVASFRKLSTSWGDQMNSVFANAIIAFLESTEEGTLADLRKFLVEKNFRDIFLKTVTDPNIIYYWQKEFPLLKSNSIGPILTRLDTFLRPKLIRNMVAQKKSVDFEMLLNTSSIVLVKLSQGLIGAENSYLLGTLIVSKIQQAAMAQQAKAKADRPDFFLYIDEFQHFITPSMSSILSGARKYHLGLLLAHQGMDQVQKQDAELASSVLANAGTRICFRVGDADAKRFSEGFSFFEASDLQNLNTGEAVVRIDRPEFDFSLSIQPLDTLVTTDEERNAIIERSRDRFATPREIVESLLSITREEISISPPEETMREKDQIQIKKEIIPKVEIKKTEPPVITEYAKAETIEQLKKQKKQGEHRYLQSLIKKMAESRGYVATIELPLPNSGRVDVSLERNKKKIACEISVSTEPQWEIHNIKKCLEAGYDLVVACSSEKDTIVALKHKIENSFPESVPSKILVFEPEHFFAYLDQEIAKEASTEVRMKGYRIKREYTPVTEVETIRQKEVIAKLITDSKKKKK